MRTTTNTWNTTRLQILIRYSLYSILIFPQDGYISYSEFEQVLYDCYQEDDKNQEVAEDDGHVEITMEILTQMRVLFQDNQKTNVLNIPSGRKLLGTLGSKYPIATDQFDLFFAKHTGVTISEGQFSELIANHERELLVRGGFSGDLIKDETTCNLLESIEEEEQKDESVYSSQPSQ